MTREEFGQSGLPRDVEEFVLLTHSRAEDKPKPTRKLSIEMPSELADSVTSLAADLGLTRSDLVNYFVRQSGERMAHLAKYVERPKEAAK